MTKIGADVFTVILVTIFLYYNVKCDSQGDNAFVSNIDKVRGLSNNVLARLLNKRSAQPTSSKIYHHGSELQRLTHGAKVQKLLKNNKYSVHPRRLVRQAYPQYRPALYPSLPTPSSNYHHQQYANHNYQHNQTSSTPPYNPQWQPSSMHNYSQPGYPGYNPSNGFNNPNQGNQGYNSNYPPYNSRPSAPVYPSPGDNPLFGHGHGHRYPYSSPSNFSNFGPQNQQGYQPYQGSSSNKYPTPGYSPSQGISNTTPPTYNPSQRPPYYPSGNTTSPNKPNYPPYSTTQRYPVSVYNNTTQRNPSQYPIQYGSYNNSQSGSFNRPGIPGYPHTPPQSGPYGSHNPGQNYPHNSYAGYPSIQWNSTAGFPGTHQTGSYNASFNGYRPNSNTQYPSHNGNNLTNTFNMNPNQGGYPYGHNLSRPNSYSGSSGHNNFAYPYYNPNQGTHNPQTNNQLPGSGYYPQPQYNGTSTYRVADYYNPNIPNQPPRKDNFGQDPTRVAPERFSY